MRLLKIILLIGIGLFLIGIIGSWVYLITISPQYSGEIDLKGLNQEVITYFDDYGIPHIYANSEEDAYLALGYLHAQERLFQMDFLRRLGGGRLAEVLGEDLVVTDRFFRTIGLRKMAEKAVKENHSDTTTAYHKAAMAYLKGVNEYIDTGATPIEFTLLGIKGEKIQLIDCYIISGYMSYSFAGGFTTDPLVNFIYETLGEAYLEDLAVQWPDEGTKIPVNNTHNTQELTNLLQLNRQLKVTLDKYPVPQFEGSNSWIIAPEKSASGNVLFENDAHMSYSQPSTWYEAHLEYPGQSIYGNFLAGFPFALIAHTKDISWGFTMFLNDDLDLYREEVNPENENEVWVNDHWAPLEIREEKIKVKDAEEIILQVKESRHGPILNHILGSDESVKKLDSANLSLWWTYHKFTSSHLEFTYNMSHATDMNTFRSIVSGIHAPGLNVMYGDSRGNIAWWAAAKLVQRPDHVNSKLVLDGASGKDEPLGFYNFSENPKNENPVSGFIYSANNQPDSIDNRLYPGYYAPDNRAERIEHLLSEKHSWTLDDFKNMVMDDISLIDRTLARELYEIMQKFNSGEYTDQQQKALEILKNWIGTHNENDIAPALYYHWLFKILELSMEDEMGKENYNLLTTTMLLKKSYPALIRNRNSLWWDDIRTEIKENRDTILFSAFEQTLDALEKNFGKAPEDWAWGKVSKLEHEHIVGRQKPLNHIFNVGPFSVSGGQEVINNKDFFLKDTDVINFRNGSAMRILIDFSDIENSKNIIPTGQSGFFMSPHYDDQAEMYNKGEFRKQMMNKQEIRENSRKLVLKPRAE